jgi:cell division protein FtsB
MSIIMVIRTRLRTFVLQLLLWMAAAAVVMYFSYHAVHGDRGLTAQKSFDAEIAQLTAQLKNVESERKSLERQVGQLRPESVDRDLLDELARDGLGWMSTQDRILVLAQ